MTHQKRLSAPKHYPIERKNNTYIKNLSGSRSKETAIPATVFLRDVLEYCDTEKEATEVIENGSLKRNGETLRDSAEGIGILDTVELVDSEETFRVIREGSDLKFVPVNDGSNKIAKIVDKNLENGEFVYRLHNGENYRADQEYETGSTLEFLEDTVEEIKLEEGSEVLVMSGKHSGKKGTVENIRDDGLRITTVEIEGDDMFETRLDNIVAFNRVSLGDEE